MKNFIGLTLWAAVILSTSIGALGQTDVTADAPYRIGLADVLDIQVFRRAELNTRVSVNPNGMIYLYRLDKPVMALCKTERELAEDIQDAYRVSHLRDPRVSVVVAEQKSQPISVIGAVDKPGRYFISKKVHLLEALALAGGPSKESGTRLIVARAGNKTNCQESFASARPEDDIERLEFKVRDIQDGRKTFWMQPGDVVSVLEADTVFVYGNVEEPGQLKVREPITLTQAIASSRGVKAASDKERVRILRQKPDSLDREEIVVNLKEIEKGRVRDPYLEANDIVAVTKDSTQAVLQSLYRAVTGGIPSVIARGVQVQ